MMPFSKSKRKFRSRFSLNAESDPLGMRKYSAPVVAFVLAAALRALYTIIAAFSVPHLLLLPALIRNNLFTEHLMDPTAGLAYSLLGVWGKFDTLNYLHIAQFGYDRPLIVVFFPLYPLLIRLLTPVFGNPLLTALVLSTFAAFFLFWGLLLLARLDFSDRIAMRAVLFYALWPASFILFCGYAESLVLALIVWSIYFARTDRWWLSGLLGCMAPLAKAVGILVVPALFILALRERRWRTLWAAFPLIGGAAYPLWLHLSGRLQWWEAYAMYWGTRTSWPWTTVLHSLQTALRLLDVSNATNPFQVMVAVGSALLYGLELAWVAIVFVLALSKRLRLEYLLYSLAAIYIILTKDSSISQQQWTRYVLVLFPAAINFSLREKDGLLFAGFTALGFAYNLLLMWFFLQWLLVV